MKFSAPDIGAMMDHQEMVSTTETGCNFGIALWPILALYRLLTWIWSACTPWLQPLGCVIAAPLVSLTSPLVAIGRRVLEYAKRSLDGIAEVSWGFIRPVIVTASRARSVVVSATRPLLRLLGTLAGAACRPVLVVARAARHTFSAAALALAAPFRAAWSWVVHPFLCTCGRAFQPLVDRAILPAWRFGRAQLQRFSELTRVGGIAGRVLGFLLRALRLVLSLALFFLICYAVVRLLAGEHRPCLSALPSHFAIGPSYPVPPPSSSYITLGSLHVHVQGNAGVPLNVGVLRRSKSRPTHPPFQQRWRTMERRTEGQRRSRCGRSGWRSSFRGTTRVR